ncbi:MAG: hypothetical protein F6K17_37955 [Okeania sp. SIO3C4]|nr:hypothetical protein [Okeania sp. SIO3B3]NER07931.1 hypothetical protein [Okeania sp. SIO3C4]
MGIKYEQLEKLLTQAIKLHEKRQELRATKKVRILASGGGRPPKLSVSATLHFNLRACHQLKRLTKWVLYDVWKWRSLC